MSFVQEKGINCIEFENINVVEISYDAIEELVEVNMTLGASINVVLSRDGEEVDNGRFNSLEDFTGFLKRNFWYVVSVFTDLDDVLVIFTEPDIGKSGSVVLS